MRAHANVVLLVVVATSCAAGPPLDPAVQAAVQAVAERHRPHAVCVAYRDLGTDLESHVDSDRVLHAASTMKIAVLIELFRQVDEGAVVLDEPLQVTNTFHSIVDGSRYVLAAADDSDAELYQQVGQTMPVRALAERMIQHSSNLATNLLIDLVGAGRVQRTVEALGTRRMQVRRGVEDGKAYRAGLNNVTSAADLMVLLTALATDVAASPAACRAMLAILEGQEFDAMIPAGLPPGTRVAHKTGQITRIQHDAAVVYPTTGTPYVLVVLTAGFDEPTDSARAVAEVAAAVHGARQRVSESASQRVSSR